MPDGMRVDGRALPAPRRHDDAVSCCTARYHKATAAGAAQSDGCCHIAGIGMRMWARNRDCPASRRRVDIMRPCSTIVDTSLAANGYSSLPF